MRVGTILEFSRRTLPQLLRCIPDLLRDDGFMGISKNDQLVLGCLAAFLDFEILADRLAKDCVSQIFLTVKNRGLSHTAGSAFPSPACAAR